MNRLLLVIGTFLVVNITVHSDQIAASCFYPFPQSLNDYREFFGGMIGYYMEFPSDKFINMDLEYHTANSGMFYNQVSKLTYFDGHIGAGMSLPFTSWLSFEQSLGFGANFILNNIEGPDGGTYQVVTPSIYCKFGPNISYANIGFGVFFMPMLHYGLSRNAFADFAQVNLGISISYRIFNSKK
jgi:hypothetical protein